MLDMIIYHAEQIICNFKQYIKEHREEPSTEEMIEAATEQLTKENNALKKLYYYPGHLLCIEDKYYCPHCKKELTQQLIEEYRIKHCIECGKRLIL